MYTLFFSKLNYTGNPIVKVKVTIGLFVYKFILDHFYNNVISIHFY